jgi:phage repressor protein C with HTH and peptisase S24 domain
MIATLQQQSCKEIGFGIPANWAAMTGLESDTAFIQSLCRWAGLSPSALAGRAGLAATTILRPFKATATTRISQPTMDKLREAFPEFPDFEQTADQPDRPGLIEYVEVSVLPSYAGMGGGGTGEGDRETALVSRHLIENEFQGRPSDFELINVRGNSMEPMFSQGDQLLIDKRDRNPIQPGPFALFDGDAYVVKLVERASGRKGWYRVWSKNHDYSDDFVEETETTIMGRPVWFARRI